MKSIDEIADRILEENPGLDRQSLMFLVDHAYENAATLVELVSEDGRFSMDVRRVARAAVAVIRSLKQR